MPSPSPAAVPERGPRRWCVLAAGIPQPAAGRTASTAGTAGTASTVSTVAPVPEPGFAIWGCSPGAALARPRCRGPPATAALFPVTKPRLGAAPRPLRTLELACP